MSTRKSGIKWPNLDVVLMLKTLSDVLQVKCALPKRCAHLCNQVISGYSSVLRKTFLFVFHLFFVTFNLILMAEKINVA